ncbi:hypothetical protein HDU90_006339 [Geranomyces variabilis]|nr:hypothetical protein HDU90_006339 [Geranomyces variabilis]
MTKDVALDRQRPHNQEFENDPIKEITLKGGLLLTRFPHRLYLRYITLTEYHRLYAAVCPTPIWAAAQKDLPPTLLEDAQL